MKIKAAVVFEKNGAFSMEQLDLGDPRDDEVIVRIVGAGICHTDLGGRDQHIPIPLPSVFGHEGAGIIERVGNRVKKVKAGDHLVISWGSCMACEACQSGHNSYCLDFFTKFQWRQARWHYHFA
jgi:aryl-alcohol dehydrogenase